MSSPEDVLKIIAEREITFVDFRRGGRGSL